MFSAIAQILTLQNFVTIILLIFMEIILSVDNALVLALLTRTLPKAEQSRAIWLGLAGSVLLRILAIFAATQVIELAWIKWLGGLYLVYVATAHAWRKKNKLVGSESTQRSFFLAVLAIMVADLAFAVDSILTAVALSNQIWIIITGAAVGILCLRLSSSLFLHLLERFPKLETSAYILVFGVGIKLLIDGLGNPEIGATGNERLEAILFWTYTALAIAYGFLPVRKKNA